MGWVEILSSDTMRTTFVEDWTLFKLWNCVGLDGRSMWQEWVRAGEIETVFKVRLRRPRVKWVESFMRYRCQGDGGPWVTSN